MTLYFKEDFQLSNLWEDSAGVDEVEFIDVYNTSLVGKSTILNCEPTEIRKEKLDFTMEREAVYRVFAPKGTKIIDVTTLPPTGAKIYKQLVIV